MTNERRQFRKQNMDMAARVGYQSTNFMGKADLQHMAVLDFAPDPRDAWRKAPEVRYNWTKEAGWKEAWQRSLTV
eukprot:8455836-Alexandrium_andersonii.AAC.1